MNGTEDVAGRCVEESHFIACFKRVENYRAGIGICVD